MYVFFSSEQCNADDISIPFDCPNISYWILYGLNIFDPTNPTFMSSILPRFYRVDAEYLTLERQNITYKEFLFLSSKIERIFFDRIIIRNENGTVVSFEKIIQALPKIKEIQLTNNFVASCITTNTVKELLKTTNFQKIDKFILFEIPEVFDIETFVSYLKKNTHTEFHLDFCSSVSMDFKIHLHEIMYEIFENKNLYDQFSIHLKMQKLRPGALTKILEKVLEKHGGSRKAFFQKYSGAHLVKMGNNMDKIIEDLPAEVTSDEKVTVTLQAIKLFFEAKKAMKSGLEMSDEEIELMKIKVIEFGTFMKNNLGSLKTKQKGHLFLFEAPEFGEMFKTCSFFSDEAIEAHNAVTNEQEKRIKCKKSPKRYSTLLKWGIYNNYYYDNISCKDYKE